ncbi:hypothetical protein ACFQXA_25625 [Nocardiopsis composta]
MRAKMSVSSAAVCSANSSRRGTREASRGLPAKNRARFSPVSAKTTTRSPRCASISETSAETASWPSERAESVSVSAAASSISSTPPSAP